MSVVPCRRTFEAFGGLKNCVIAARDGAPATKEILVRGTYDKEDDTAADSSNAETATIADLHLAYIAFDILYIQNEVCFLVLSAQQMCLGHYAILRLQKSWFVAHVTEKMKGR